MYQSKRKLRDFDKNRINPFDVKSTKIITDFPSEHILINKQFLPKVFGLSRTAIKLLLYLLTNQTTEKTTVNFDLKKCKSLTGFNDNRSIYNGLIELLGEGIIAREKNKHVYYLNKDIINIYDQTK